MTKQKPERKRPSISLGTVLLYLAAAFQATQYARAFHAIDSTSQWADAGGLIAGIVVNVSLAYSASRLPRIKAKGAKRWATGAFIALIILTPVFLAPINYSTMGTLWAGFPMLKWTLAALSASLVDIAIALVAFADGSLMPAAATLSNAGATLSDAGSDAQPRSATKKGRSAKAANEEATLAARVYRCECGETFADRFKYSGHTRICTTRKAIREGKDLIPVDMTTPAKVER